MSLLGDIQDAVGGEENATYLAIGVSLVLVFLTTLLIWLCRASRAKGRGVLLIGLHNAGKTLMFWQLRHSEEKETFMSIKENTGKLSVETGNQAKSVDLVDIPGHDTLRTPLIKKYIASARGIVCVVDSVNFTKEVQSVAKLIYGLLADSVVVRSRLPILVACNKQDITTAKSAKLIKQMLEKEIDALRKTRAAALSDINDQRAASTVPVGKEGKEFSFGDVHPVRVEVVECSSRGSAATSSDRSVDLASVHAWIQAQA